MVVMIEVGKGVLDYVVKGDGLLSLSVFRRVNARSRRIGTYVMVFLVYKDRKANLQLLQSG